MCGAEPSGEPVDEFDWIAQDLRPLAAAAPGAFDLLDDAAAIQSRPGFDLIVSKDAIVEGVHFLTDDPMDLIARKLLRVNLSDLAAKGAEPYGYFLAVAWPKERSRADRAAFAAGLKTDQETFGLHLLGGDTVSTPGPFTASLTILGWAPAGKMVRRATARIGDVVLVSGTIGDGGLGLAAARSELSGPPADAAWLADRYRLPQPRMGLGEPLRRFASGAADVSDGLVADAGRIGIASGLGIEIDLARVPLSAPAARWLATQTNRAAGLVRLVTGGDDYEIVCTASPNAVSALKAAATAAGVPLTEIGRVTAGSGVRVNLDGTPVPIASAGYRHG